MRSIKCTQIDVAGYSEILSQSALGTIEYREVLSA